MKVLHSGTLDVNAGGPAMSTYLTLLGLRQQGVEAEIIMFPLSPTGRLRGEKVPVHYTAAPKVPKLLYSSSYKRDVRGLGDYDIYHAQGVWQYPTYALADVAKRAGKPYIITPRGMLYPQDIQKSNKFFKELSLKFKLLYDLNHAACVHVTCKDEMMHCRNLGVTSPIAIIPNPVEIKEYKERKQDSIFRLGYLGRLSPRKNVESLIYAWNTLREKVTEAELQIIGSGNERYNRFLKSKVKRLNLKNVRFTSFLFEQEKADAIASISVMAIPSEFENLGNVILESLARKIPCIATTGSPWEELNTHKCGWWVEYNQEAIITAVNQALSLSQEQLVEVGKKGRQLMETNYSIEAVARRMKDLYQWIVSERECPETEYLLINTNRGGANCNILIVLQPFKEERRAA